MTTTEKFCVVLVRLGIIVEQLYIIPVTTTTVNSNTSVIEQESICVIWEIMTRKIMNC